MRRLRLAWPVENPHPGTRFWGNQVLSCLRTNNVRIEFADIAQEPGFVVRTRVTKAGATHMIAFDNNDDPQIAGSIAEESLLYFKTQFSASGYAQPNVVPGGYFLANISAYRILPLLRVIRRLQRFRYDVYGRFGLRYGGAEIRRHAYELLAARSDFTFEGSVFRYPGGPEKVPYREYLFEIPRAKVCVAMPGAGELTCRLVDYLAVGACVVSPPIPVRLPVELVDGRHIVYCASDLSDLADVCAQLAREDVERERIARNARDYFDRNLRREQLGKHYVGKIEAAADRLLEPAVLRRRRIARRATRSLAAVALAALLLVDIFVVIPEKLGDRPYNAVGHDTRPTR